MSFDLRPVEYLRITQEEYKEFLKDQGSIRRAMSCCILTNHIIDHVVACYYPSDAGKLHILPSLKSENAVKAYRDHVVGECPNVSVIRDVCDFGKHGPKLRRSNIVVERTGVREIYGFYPSFLPIRASNYTKRSRVLITKTNREELYLPTVLSSVLGYWNAKFLQDTL